MCELNGVGEANFLGGVASVKGVTGFDPEKAKKRFFEIYLDKVRCLPCTSNFCVLLHGLNPGLLVCLILVCKTQLWDWIPGST